MSKQRRVFWIALCFTMALTVTLALVAANVRANRNRISATLTEKSIPDRNKPEPTSKKTTPGPLIGSAMAQPPAASPDDEEKSFWLTLRAGGFTTKEMTISAGQYFVIVQNASGLDDFGLLIQRETGQRIHDVRLPRRKKHWRQVIHFTPGTYIVSEASHPGWNCRITVTPHE